MCVGDLLLPSLPPIKGGREVWEVKTLSPIVSALGRLGSLGSNDWRFVESGAIPLYPFGRRDKFLTAVTLGFLPHISAFIAFQFVALAEFVAIKPSLQILFDLVLADVLTSELFLHLRDGKQRIPRVVQNRL